MNISFAVRDRRLNGTTHQLEIPFQLCGRVQETKVMTEICVAVRAARNIDQIILLLQPSAVSWLSASMYWVMIEPDPFGVPLFSSRAFATEASLAR